MHPHFLDLGTSWRWVDSFTPRPLYPTGKQFLVLIGYEAGWTPEPVWTMQRSENSWPYRDSNSDPSVIQSVASCYTAYTIPVPIIYAYIYIYVWAINWPVLFWELASWGLAWYRVLNSYQCFTGTELATSIFLFYPEDGRSRFFQVIGTYLPDHRRQQSS
jgi:hypothetical protein